MDLKFSEVTRKGPITIVTLSRPEVYNALHTDAHFELNNVSRTISPPIRNNGSRSLPAPATRRSAPATI